MSDHPHAQNHARQKHQSPGFIRGTRGQVWQRAQLRNDEDTSRERRVGWLELFFDLVFVVVISQLSHHLAKHLDATGVLQFIALFVPVWWVWIGGMYYAERFETGDLSFRLFIFLQMLPVAGMALTVPHAFDGHWAQFATTYILARLIIIFLWWRGARHDPSFGPTAVRFNTGFVISVIFWSFSLFTSLEVSIGLAVTGLVFDLTTPWTTIEQQSRLPRLSSSHLPERFGLFVIIVLGEAIIAVVNGVAQSESLEWPVLLNGVLGMILVFAIWWVYFDFVGRRTPKPQISSTLPWSYLHMPLVIGISASSAGALSAFGGELNDAVRWLMAGATAVKLISIGLIEYTLQRDPGEPTHEHLSPMLKFFGAALALLLGVFGTNLNLTAFLFALLVPTLIQILYGLFVWFNRYPESLGADLP